MESKSNVRASTQSNKEGALIRSEHMRSSISVRSSSQDYLVISVIVRSRSDSDYESWVIKSAPEI